MWNLPPGLLRFHGTSTHYSEAADPAQQRALLAWADGERQAGLVKADSLDFAASAEFDAHTALCDVIGIGCGFRYRKIGNEMGGWSAEDRRRELDAIEPQAYRQVIRRQYLETVRARQPLLHLVFAETPSGVYSYSRLTVPLAVRTAEVGRLWLIPAGWNRFVDRLRESAALAA
jgi:hypothetical protein